MRNLKFVPFLLFIAFSTLVSAQDYPFSVKIYGDGEQAIVFIPGFACSGAVWEETVAGFEDDYKCYVLTMAGFAGEQPQSTPSFDGWKTQIAEYISDKKIENPIIVGHSMGGGLALAIASDYPDLLSKVVVVDVLPCLAALRDPGFQSKPDNDCSVTVERFTNMADEEFAQMQNMNIASLTTDTSKFKEIVGWSLASDRETFAMMYCDFLNTDLRTKIGKITVPVLVLLEPTFKNMEPAIEGQYKNLKTADIKYAGKGLHFIMYDDKDWYLKQLDEFISLP